MALLGNLTGSSQFFNDPDFYNEIATQSLRFDDGSSHKLTRTFSGAVDNDKKMTISVWAKRGNLSGSNQVIIANYNQVRFLGELMWNSDNKISFDPGGNGNGASNSYAVQTTALFRDVSSWYHIVLAYDSTQSTDTNRVKLYVNGTQQTLSAGSGFTFPPQNYAHLYSYAGANNTIGEFGANFNSGFLDGYLSEFNFIDGLTLDPTYFGETKNGVWIAKEYEGSYGTNGYRLEFKQTGTGTASASTIGADTSGNNNHWTSSGTAAHDCAMPDSPENNFCTLNPLESGKKFADSNQSLMTQSEGNLKFSGGRNVFGTIGVNSGKWYWEIINTSNTVDSVSVSGVITQGTQAEVYGVYYNRNGNKGLGLLNGGATESSYGATYTDDDIISVALNMDDNQVTFFKNNASQGTITDANLAGGDVIAWTQNGANNGTLVGVYNFGQDDTFAGAISSAGNTDGNGKGVFKYAPPSGFLALCSANLPEPTISPNALTQADDYFNTVLYTGSGSSPNAITGVGFQPDWVWIKKRSAAVSHAIFDSSRGVTSAGATNKAIGSDRADAEGNGNGGLSAFGSDGFTLVDGSSGSYPRSLVNDSATYVAWNWKANGGTTSSNTDGSITSTVQANTTAGFSIVTWTGTGSNATVGHGLGAVPKMYIVKRRDANGHSWAVYNSNLGATKQLRLSGTNAEITTANIWNNTEPTSSVFSVGTNTDSNASSGTHIAYCFAEIESYSRFGKYTGNGSADGTFVHTGFRPAWVLIKRTDTSGNDWMLVDSTRDTINVVDNTLFPSDTTQELDGDDKDFVSNGFKHRSTGASENASGGTYIYMAFAEAPFKYANAR